MGFISSQGFDAFGLTSLKKASVKVSRVGNKVKKIDASTLDIPHGGERVYEDGLPDAGPTPGDDGIVVTLDVECFGVPPEEGDFVTVKGKVCRCMESTTDADVGVLAGGSASFTSDYDHG